MKPIKVKTFLVQNILIVLSVMLAILGVILAAKSIPFFPSIEANLVNEETTVQVAQGLMPLSHVALYLSFLLIYLVFEFYGFKPAFYTSLNIALSILLCYGIFILVNRFALDPENSNYDNLLSQLLIIRPRTVISLTAGVLFGFSAAFILAATIKTLTRNYFMFIRFPIAAAVGFGIFTAIVIYVNNLNILAPESMMLEAVAPFSQFLTLIIASVIPLYILRLILGLFRGRMKDDESKEIDADKSLFKGSESSEIPPAPQPQQNILPPPQEQGKEPAEDTVSKKIAFNGSSAQN